MSIPKLYALAGIKLKPAGPDKWKAPCPFHVEEDPSFVVYDDGSYHCFGCGAHGTIYTLYEGVNVAYQQFPDITGAQEEKREVLDKLKKRMQKKVDQELSNQDVSLKGKLYDVFDLTFLHAAIKLQDPDVNLIDIILFVRKKCNQILNHTVKLTVKKIKFSS